MFTQSKFSTTYISSLISYNPPSKETNNPHYRDKKNGDTSRLHDLTRAHKWLHGD